MKTRRAPDRRGLLPDIAVEKCSKIFEVLAQFFCHELFNSWKN